MKTCIHCGGARFHRPNCVSYLARRAAALEVNSTLPAAPIAEPGAKFVAVRRAIMRGAECVANAVSHTMARRIANALNNHTPNSKGY